MSVTESPVSSQERLSLADLPDVANVKELALFLGVSEWSVREQVHRNEIPFQRIGEKIVFLKPAILRHLGLSETDVGAGMAGRMQPARVFLLHPIAAGISDELTGWACAEGAFLRFRRSENRSGTVLPDLFIPAHSISWVEFFADERALR